MKKNVLIKFNNEKAAKFFLDWLCNSGEQSYFNYQSEHCDEDSDEYVASLDYWGGDKEPGEFCEKPVRALNTAQNIKLHKKRGW